MLHFFFLKTHSVRLRKSLLTFKLHYFPRGGLRETLQTYLTGQSQADTTAAEQKPHLADTCILNTPRHTNTGV